MKKHIISMKRMVGLLITVTVLFGGSGVGNALQVETADPGFESGTGWGYTSDSYITYARGHDDVARSGNWGIQFKTTVGWLSQITYATADQNGIYVTGGREYIFSAWQKSVTPYAWISLRVEWYGVSDELLSSDRVDFGDSLNNDWEFRRMTRTSPSSAKTAKVSVIAVLHPWAARTVYIDDVYFIPAPAAGLADPSFEVDAGWHAGPWHFNGSGTDWRYLDVIQTPEAAYTGLLGFQVDSYVGWLGSINMGVAEQPSIAITGGTEYVFSAWQNSVTEFTWLSLAIEWFDAFNNSVGFNQADFGDSLNNNWELRSMTRTAPVTATRAKVTVMGIIHPWAQRTLYIDDVHFAPAQNKIAGDANGDNKVDVSDLGILAAHYGTTIGATWETGDFNNDGKVDVSDLGILAAHYGTGPGRSLDFKADYAKAFGATVADKNDSTNDTASLGCSTLGLPLIAGLLLMGMAFYKHEE